MSRIIPVIKGLYAITPDGLETPDLLQRAGQALAGGAAMLQYRNKSADAALRLMQAQALRKLAWQFSVPLIINDDAQLAAQVDADGVHLGATDGSLTDARAILGKGKIIGVSCYNRPLLARQAKDAGADYVALGAFYQSGTKPGAVKADVNLLRQVRHELEMPIVAIGGITAENGAVLIKAGAAALAVISALFDAADTEAAAKEFTELFKQSMT